MDDSKLSCHIVKYCVGATFNVELKLTLLLIFN